MPEYVAPLDEDAVQTAAFELLFAFDEVISLGYKEHVTVQQARCPALCCLPRHVHRPLRVARDAALVHKSRIPFLLLPGCVTRRNDRRIGLGTGCRVSGLLGGTRR